MTPIFVDSHAHLDMEVFSNDLEGVLERAERAGTGVVINVGTDLVSSQKALDLAEKNRQIWAAVGVHPHEATKFTGTSELGRLAESNRVIAVGETGLDYYRDLSPRDIQQQVFREHLRLGLELGLPVIVHCREAYDDVFRIIMEEKVCRGVMHCFSGGTAQARAALDLGFYLSMAGPITYPGSALLREVVTFVPLDRMLVETDAPYLAPQAFRGKRNEPAFVRAIAEQCATLKGTSLEHFARITTGNALRLFHRIHLEETGVDGSFGG